jgi:hypothetical protein
MDNNDFSVVADLRILSVEVSDDDVFVDLVGGEPPRCASVRYRFRSDERDENVETLRHWCLSGTPVTFVDRGSEVSLVDSTRLLQRLLADPTS